MAVSQGDKPWTSYLTIDLLNTVFQRTILHPWVAWMVPLSLRAQVTPYHHPAFIISTAYALFLTLLWMFRVISNRVAYGLPRDVDLAEEVMVITGGASGLGLLIAEVYGMRGASVAVLDVKDLEGVEGRGITYYKCDVGDRKQVDEVARRIEQELGPPTILINNAGIVNGKTLLELSGEEIERNFQVNLLSHFYTLKAFLPGMLEEERGTIVTISSVLGQLGAARLSDYSAAKAGLLAMHASLTMELSQLAEKDPRAEYIKTILVTPGQVATPLFSGVKTPSNFLAPVVEPIEIAKEIIKMVDNGFSGELAAPLYARHVGWYHVLPVGVKKAIRLFSGVDTAMSGFGGRKGS